MSINSPQTGPGGTSTVQDLEYQWDKVGNLTQRRDLNCSHTENCTLTEDFTYDDLHRLDYSKLSGVQNLDVSYDAMGNIMSKDDVGTCGQIVEQKMVGGLHHQYMRVAA